MAWGVKSVFGGHKSTAGKVVNLKIIATGESFDYPCQAVTTVGEIKEMLSAQTKREPHDIQLFYKQGAYLCKQLDINEVSPKTLIKGIKGFQAQKHEWPHPTGIIGQGYHGLKTAMTYVLDNKDDFVCFDRNDKVGGYCWITGANKTSRLQTEFGSFHVWWGPGTICSGKMNYPNCNDSNGWSIWPYKSEILQHFDHAAECFGIKPHIKFQTHVAKMEIIGGRDDESRLYELACEGLAGQADSKVKCSVVWTFPGSLTQNRIIDYPGEDLFDGAIRYGMNDDTPYEKLVNTKVAILGNGAFAVENARTVLECGGNKAYIVTRRMNLASPRIPSWFVHQGPIPTPGGFVLKMFEPMYELVGFGDPWSFHAVHANEARTNVTLLQNSRFGIGDVTFLMVAWGLLEYHETTLKRCSKHTLHLNNGEQLDGVTVILKALGLLGDWSIDKLHGMKEMVGMFCGGDFRRPLMIDATGMNAANFTTFSTGIGTTDFVLAIKYFYDFPKQWEKAVGMGALKQLPKHKEEPDIEKPAYVCDVKIAMTSSIILSGLVPESAAAAMGFGSYKYTMYHRAHSTNRALEVAEYEWYKWQAEWKERGFENKHTPGGVVKYPYTREIMEDWCTEWSERMKMPIHVDGPDKLPVARGPWEDPEEARQIDASRDTQNRPPL